MILSDGLLKLALCRQRDCQVVMSDREIRLKLYRAACALQIAVLVLAVLGLGLW